MMLALTRYIFKIKRPQERQIFMNPVRTKRKSFVDFMLPDQDSNLD